jgi:hypothetical protein
MEPGLQFGAPAPAATMTVEGTGQSSNTLQTTQRQVISVASVSIEVETVSDSVDQVRAIAESLGGLVEQLSSSGNAEQAQATMTIRVPQDEFFTALERIEDLGEVQNRHVGSDDVSEEFIDLEARLASAQREETSLLGLLERANSVTEILTIERELSRVRSEVERTQGRLNFLERRVALATITVSLFPPQADTPEPPSAALVVASDAVPNQVEQLRALVTSLNGEMDRVFLSTRNGLDRAEISFRVHTADFNQAAQFAESLGELRNKELQEGSDPAGVTPADEPDARITLTLVEEESSRAWIIGAIATPVGLIILVAAVVAGLWLSYRAGRGKRSFV